MIKNKLKNKIPDGWEIEKLGEVGNAYIGLTYAPRDVSGSGTLVFRSSNVQNGKIDYSDNVFVDVEDIPEKNIVKEGDILICARNGSKRLIGKNALITKDEEGNAFGAFMSIYRTKQYKYFFQLFQSPLYKKEIERDLGPTINQVTTGNLLKFKFAIPPLPEQKRIVGILEVWDEGIEKLERKIEIKEDVKKGLMQQLLTGKKRLPGFSSEWKKVQIGKLLDYEQPTNYIVDSTDYEDEFKTPVLTAGKTFILGYTNEENNIFPKEKLPVIIFDDFTTANKFVDFEFKVKSSAMKILKNKDENISDIIFIFGAMQLLNFQVGEHKRNYLSEYQYLDINLPSLKEQKAIAKVLITTNEEIEMLRKKLKILKDQKKFLLNNLVTGNIRVPEKV